MTTGIAETTVPQPGSTYKKFRPFDVAAAGFD
jgi:hypothetical protein